MKTEFEKHLANESMMFKMLEIHLQPGNYNKKKLEMSLPATTGKSLI